MATPLSFFASSLPASALPPRTASASAAAAASASASASTSSAGAAIVDSNHVTAWDISRVAAWVVSAGFAGYDRRFLDNDISGDVLVHLSDDLLQELGIEKVGVRIAMLKAIYSLKRAHGVPIEVGDFVPIVPESFDHGRQSAPSEKKKSLFSFLDHHGSDVDPKKLVDAFRQQSEQLHRVNNEIAALHTELQRLKDDLNPVLTMNKEYQSILEKEKRLQQQQQSSGGSSGPTRKKSPTLLTRSLTTGGISNSVPSLPSAVSATGAGSGGVPWSPTGSIALASAGSLPSGDTETFGTIKVFGDRLQNRTHEGYKSFKVHRDETCSMFLPVALRKYKIHDDWSQYALFIIPASGNERCLGYDEYPLRVYNEYFVTAPASPEPYFVMRHIKQVHSPMSREAPAEPPTAVYATQQSAAMQYRSAGGANGSPGTPPQLNAPLPAALPPPASVVAALHSSQGPVLPINVGGGGSGSMNPIRVADDVESRHASNNSQQQQQQPAPAAPSSSSSGANAAALPAPTESSRAVAVYEYKAQRPDELSLIIGDTVVIRSRSTGWCVVDKRGEHGWVPAGCLVEENKGEDRIEGMHGRVLFDYDKIGPNELSIKKGDSLKLIKGYQHWLLVESGGTQGWVPSCYVNISRSKDGHAKKPRPASPAPDLFRGALQHVVGAGSGGAPGREGSPGSPVTASGPPSAYRRRSGSSAALMSIDTAASAAAAGGSTSAPAGGAVGGGGGPSSSAAGQERRLDVATQELMDLLVRCRASVDACSSNGGPSPSPLCDLEAATRNQLLGNSINLLQLLAQLPPSSSRYAMTAERLERLTLRVRGLDPPAMADEVHSALAELVNAVKGSKSGVYLSGATTGTTGATGGDGGVAAPPTPPPKLAMASAAAAAAAAQAAGSSSTPPPRMASVTPPPSLGLAHSLSQSHLPPVPRPPAH
ncbi:hypothetical protein H9P43_000981 [Blastocladiella emersonii ATCC 22665]|nr:hypothetical protein H9P43_000981 [Blastocladiella emersonii ATCC 22665]